MTKRGRVFGKKLVVLVYNDMYPSKTNDDLFGRQIVVKPLFALIFNVLGSTFSNISIFLYG